MKFEELYNILHENAAPKQKLEYVTEESKILNNIQTALDVIGIEPTIGSVADAGNSVISILRAALSSEPDQRKKHLINAGISAVAIIPGADLIKLLKLRKYKPVAKAAVTGLRKGRTAARGIQAQGDRFDEL